MYGNLVASQDSHCDFQKLIGQTRVELQSASTLFKRTDNTLPTRIVTAIQRPDYNLTAIPFECSLGVVHIKRPPKRFHWGVVHTGHRSILAITSYPEFYGDPLGSKITIKMLTADGNTYEKVLAYQSGSGPKLNWLEVNELFAFDGQSPCCDYAYITAYSDYGGFFMFTAINKNDSWTMEHTF